MKQQSIPVEVIRILEESLSDPVGEVSGGYYDTGQVVRQWARRPDRIPDAVGRVGLEFLLNVHNPDGSWGNRHWPASYRLVPTLGAAAGCLAAAARGVAGCDGTRRVVDAACRGLEFLVRDPACFAPSALPDTVAIELIVPALLEEMEQALHSDGGRTGRSGLPAAVCDGLRARVGQALAACAPYRNKLNGLRRAAQRGGALPVHISHSLEVLDGPPARLGEIAKDGPVGCSPAATAAVLAWAQTPSSAAVDFLARQAARCGGAQPDVLPIASFERSWGIGPLVRLGLPIPDDIRRRMVAYFRDVLGTTGVPLGPGLPIDGDLTSTVLFLLARLGSGVEPTVLGAFRGTDAFVNYFDERTVSITTNAHMLEAFGAWLELDPTGDSPYRLARDKIRSFLLDAQKPDGSWTDKWHASPVYATVCVAPALDWFGGPDARPAVRRAVRWILDTQRPDGSWGEWHGTLEDTAHALHLLLIHNRSPEDAACRQAVQRGAAFLMGNLDAASTDAVRMPLWHGKELFQPERISRLIVLSALWRCHVSTQA